MTHNRPARRLARRAAGLAGAVALLAGAACSDFLTAENPGAIEADDLNELGYTALLANAAQFGFQAAQDDMTYWNGQFTDEIINRQGPNPFAEEGLIDRRELNPDMTYLTAFIYNPMQRARFLGEDAAARLKVILADSATRDVRVARSLAYAGYSYVMLAESMCQIPIDRGVPMTPAVTFDSAIARFEEAIAIATAQRTYALGLTTPNTALANQADSVRNMALVGAARAALNMNDKNAAIAFASQVAANYQFREYYHNNTNAQRHRFWDRYGASGAGVSTLTGTPFEAATYAADPRVPRRNTPASAVGTPLSPSSYSTYNGLVGNAGGAFADIRTQRVGSHLEAQYVIAEASLNGGTGPGAMTADQVLAFINTRRAAGSQTPLAAGLSNAQLFAELRDQRARDFYLDGHRLGDLRRYLEFYQIDLFPTGNYPQQSGTQYSDDVCWPLPTSELNDNPNV
jgi:hypothetical protein